MGAFTSRPATVACNGALALCNRPYSNVTQIGTHDSAFVGILPVDNQMVSVTSQLDAGIRFLQAQTHVSGGELHMCHTSCAELDAGLLTTYLSTIKTWMDGNQNQVVTLLLTNGDYVPVSMFANDMTSTGIANYAYTPPNQLAMSDWPTLQNLIDQNKRLVTFLDYDADTTVAPYILPEFSYIFETAYDVTSFGSCALDRPPNSNGAGLMMLVNHFKDLSIFGLKIPDVADTAKTNAATGSGSIGEQATLCENTWGRNPNLILVDNFNIGQVLQAQNTLNGV